MFSTYVKILTVFLVVGFVASKSIQGTGHPFNLEMVGFINNKVFFLDRNITITWDNARVYCENTNNMSLANFGNTAEVEHVLGNILGLEATIDYVWTGGLERVHNVSSFSWRYSSSSSGSINAGINIVNSQAGSFAGMALKVDNSTSPGFTAMTTGTLLRPLCVLCTLGVC